MSAFPNAFEAGVMRPPLRPCVEYLCWSRMQAEAGQDLDRIVRRKELERRAGGGLFLWGVGNAPSTSISALARIEATVPVVFSIMKSRPKAVDAAPTAIVAWRRFIDADGVERDLPASTIVTSRRDSARGAKRVHYALMCYSTEPLHIERGEPFDVTAYRNASGAGAPIGASQVTALLRRVKDPAQVADYEVNLRAQLTRGYWVRLTNPVEVPSSISERLTVAGGFGLADWTTLAHDIRCGKVVSAREPDLLFV